MRFGASSFEVRHLTVMNRNQALRQEKVPCRMVKAQKKEALKAFPVNVEGLFGNMSRCSLSDHLGKLSVLTGADVAFGQHQTTQPLMVNLDCNQYENGTSGCCTVQGNLWPTEVLRQAQKNQWFSII
jgi:hypothetical protein